jgi:ABC-type transport system involved in cytochrome bd biosynthesis fused ATPase/permease subunit
MEHIISILASVVVTVVASLLLFFAQRHFKRAEESSEKAEERRAEQQMLILQTVQAIGELTMASAIAVKNGHTNGEMQKAMDHFNEVDKELNKFLIRTAARKTAKNK